MTEYVPDTEYIDQKKQEYKARKLRERVRNNTKSQQGFGYTYKPIQFDYPDEA